MADELISIYTARSEAEACFLRDLLAAEGIRAEVTNATLAGGRGVDYVGWQTQPRVMVDVANAAKARAFAEDFDRRAVAAAAVRSESDETAADPKQGWMRGAAAGADEEGPSEHAAPPANWPLCPKCGARRLTRCPVCGTAGTGFPAADAPSPPETAVDVFDTTGAGTGCGCGPGGCGSKVAADESTLGDATAGPGESAAAEYRDMLVCTTCDEPFRPQYAARCEWCGHDFGEGFESSQLTGASTENLNPRVIGVVVALGLIFAVAAVYFLLILPG